MLKNLYNKTWFPIIIHLVILTGIFSNGFYILENYKIYTNYQKIFDAKTILEMNKKNITEKNSYEFLESYKDKAIKNEGYKIAGEEVFDISEIDQRKELQSTSIQTPNYYKWYKCFNRISKDTFQYNDFSANNSNLQDSISLCK